jgi:hypothetical protein
LRRLPVGAKVELRLFLVCFFTEEVGENAPRRLRCVCFVVVAVGENEDANAFLSCFTTVVVGLNDADKAFPTNLPNVPVGENALVNAFITNRLTTSVAVELSADVYFLLTCFVTLELVVSEPASGLPINLVRAPVGENAPVKLFTSTFFTEMLEVAENALVKFFATCFVRLETVLNALANGLPTNLDSVDVVENVPVIVF